MDSVITCLCVLCEFPWKSHGWRIIVVTNGWATTPQQLELQNNEQLFRFCWRKEWIIEFSPLFSLWKKNCQKDVSPQIVKRKKDNRRWCYRLKSVAYIRCFEKSTHSEKVLQLATKTFIIWKHRGKIMFLQLQEESDYHHQDSNYNTKRQLFVVLHCLMGISQTVVKAWNS